VDQSVIWPREMYTTAFNVDEAELMFQRSGPRRAEAANVTQGYALLDSAKKRAAPRGLRERAALEPHGLLLCI